MTVRAKFQCLSVRKYKSTVWDTEGKNATQGFAFEYIFQAVTDGSAENKRFFASTPYGDLKMGAMRDDLFVPGQDYYLDFILPQQEAQ